MIWRKCFPKWFLPKISTQDSKKKNLGKEGVLTPGGNLRGGIVHNIMKNITHHTQEIGLDMDLFLENKDTPSSLLWKKWHWQIFRLRDEGRENLC